MFAERKALNFISLVMINVIAVDSLRSLTAGAEYGFALITFYLLGALLFFIPTMLVTAELATGWPSTGGVYIWVREAFGPRWGLLTIWLQWIYNMVWFPTILAFIAGILAYLINPTLANNKIYMLAVILSVFWLATWVNSRGIKSASWVSTIGALVGTIIPMLFIIGLGVSWVYLGKPSQIHFSFHNLFPSLNNLTNLAFLTNVLFGLMGMEMSAVHAGDVSHPQRNYPRALLVSGAIIFTTLVLSCLAITIVVPAKQLNLVSGLMDAFAIFFNAYHLSWCIPVIAFLIILGSISTVAAWVLGPARGLQVAVQDTQLPAFLQKINGNNAPIGILLTQGIVVTILCTVFLIMPSVNSSFWILSNLTAQLGLLFYILMFSAAICLRYKHPKVERSYKIPGGKWGIWLVAGIGIMTCIVTLFIGFLPPTQVVIGKIMNYEAILVIGIVLSLIIPFIFYSPLAISE